MDNYEKEFNTNTSNSTNSATNEHCPNCKGKGKEKENPQPEKKCYNESYGGTPGHRGEQLYFPSLENSTDAPPSDDEYQDEAFQDEDTDNYNR